MGLDSVILLYILGGQNSFWFSYQNQRKTLFGTSEMSPLIFLKFFFIIYQGTVMCTSQVNMLIIFLGVVKNYQNKIAQ